MHLQKLMLMNAEKPIKLNKDRLEVIIGLQCFIIVALIIFRLVYQPLFFRQESLIYTFCCVLCVTTFWYFWSWHLVTKSLFNPYPIFLLSAFLFNGGKAFLEVFHINEDVMENWQLASDLLPLASETVIDTLFLIIIGLSGLHLGALISLAKLKVKSYKSDSNNSLFILNNKKSRIVGWRLICVSILPAIVVIGNTMSIVLSSGYTALYQVDSATSYSAGPAIIADFLIPGSFFLLAGSKDNRKHQLTSLFIVCFYTGIRFILGQRNQAVMPLISFAWLWHKLIKPIPKTFLLSIGSLMLLILPLVSAMRNTVGEDRFSISFLQETFSSINNPVVTSISEMGGSMLTVGYILELVPSQKEFQAGADYFYALLTLIPNFFGKLHPTIARGLPEHWMTEQINPHFHNAGGSYGFSFIAEAYLNFGWIGAPIALGVIGFLFTKLVLWAVTSSEDPAKMAMVASFLSVFLFYPRAESALIVRGLVWYSLIPYLWVHLIKSSSSKAMKK